MSSPLNLNRKDAPRDFRVWADLQDPLELELPLNRNSTAQPSVLRRARHLKVRGGYTAIAGAGVEPRQRLSVWARGVLQSSSPLHRPAKASSGSMVGRAAWARSTATAEGPTNRAHWPPHCASTTRRPPFTTASAGYGAQQLMW